MYQVARMKMVSVYGETEYFSARERRVPRLSIKLLVSN